MYIFETTVRYSECDGTRQAGLSNVLDYLQDAAAFQAEELAVGISWLKESRKVWVLSSWQVDIARYPQLGEHIRILTWPYDFYGFTGYRNFKIEDQNGEVLVRANSVWVFMDLDKRRPAKLEPEIIAAYQPEERLEMEYLDRKLPDFKPQQAGEPFHVPHYFIDTNRHVNNARYVLLAKELLPQDYQVTRIRAEYRRSAVEGDMLYPFSRSDKDKVSVKLCDKDGKPYAAMELYGGCAQRPTEEGRLCTGSDR